MFAAPQTNMAAGPEGTKPVDRGKHLMQQKTKRGSSSGAPITERKVKRTLKEEEAVA